MDAFRAIVLGLVQGLTEFLPISSSGHLTIVPWLFNWEQPGLAFDAALHLGTLLAVLIYFRAELWRLIQAIPVALANLPACLTDKPLAHPRAADARLGVLIVIGSIPGGVLGLLLNDRIDSAFHSQQHQDRALLAIAGLLAGFAALLFVAERVGRQKRVMTNLRMRDTIVIGLAQAIALFPGTSRSGVTMTAALFQDMERAEAARFSFLLGFPLILAASLTGLSDVISANDVSTGNIMLGIAFSAISGLFAISWLIAILKRLPTTMFTIYRVAAAVVIVLLIATGLR